MSHTAPPQLFRFGLHASLSTAALSCTMGRVRRYKKLKACDPFAPKAKRELSPER